MAIDPEIRDLLTSALLNLDPRIIDKRIALHSVLVEVGLYTAKCGCTIAEIKNQVNRIVSQGSFLSDDECIHAVNDCLSRRTVYKDDDNYSLSESKVLSFSQAFEFSDALTGNVERDLVERIEIEVGEPLEANLAHSIFAFVRRFVTEEVYERSLHLARQDISFEEMVLQLESSEPNTRMKEALSDLLPKERELLRSQVLGGILAYFKDMPPDLEEMLRLIHHTVLINQILNLDPSMVRLQKEWFSRRRLYLDTNVVLGFLFEAQKRHKVVQEVILASINLGVQLFISPVTLDELKRQVARAKKNYRAAESVPVIKALAPYGDDAIFATFLHLKRRQPSLNWDSYIAPFENPEETLLHASILVEETGFEEARAHPNYERLYRAIKDSKPFYVSEAVLEHDTLNCALILHLRQTFPPDERGQVVWLLTIDRSLRKSQRSLFGSGEIENPYCIQAVDWGDIVLPAQNLMGFVFNDFIGYLAQAKLGAITQPDIVQLDFLETINDAAVDVDRLWQLHPQQVRATISKLQINREVQQLLERAAHSKNEAERNQYQAQFLERLDQAIEDTDPVKQAKEIYERRMSLLEKRLKSREEEVTLLRERVISVESTLGYRFSTWLNRIFGKK